MSAHTLDDGTGLRSDGAFDRRPVELAERVGVVGLRQAGGLSHPAALVVALVPGVPGAVRPSVPLSLAVVVAADSLAVARAGMGLEPASTDPAGALLDHHDLRRRRSPDPRGQFW